MLCSRIDDMARSLRSLKDDVAQLSKVSTQTCSGVVELHPRVGQVVQSNEKLKTSFTKLVGLLEGDHDVDADAERQQG